MSPLSTKLSIPRLTSSEAQALASLATHGAGLFLSDLPKGQTGSLFMSPLAPGEISTQASETQRMHIEWAGGQLALDLQPWVIDRWMGMILGITGLNALPDEFRMATMEHAIQWIIQKLDTTGRGNARLKHVETSPSPRPLEAPHAISIQIETASGELLPSLLHLDSLALMLVGSLAQSAPQQADSRTWENLPIPVELCIGQTLLPMQQFKTIQIGGCILLAESYMQSGQGIQLRTPISHRQQWIVRASIDGQTITLLSQPKTMTTMPNVEHDDSPPNWDNMPVQVSFDLGQKMLTLAELRQFNEGQAISLDRPVQAGVTIRANGAVIGQGQLVDIDGQMGVLVSQLNAPSGDTNE